MMNDWKAQEEAFFGTSSSTPASKSVAKPKSSSMSSYRYDLNSSVGKKDRNVSNSVAIGQQGLNKADRKSWSRLHPISTLSPHFGSSNESNNRAQNDKPQHQEPFLNSFTETLARCRPAHIDDSIKNDVQNSLPDSKNLASFFKRTAKQFKQNVNRIVPQCVVCGTIAPSPYQYHPFFSNEKACASHKQITKCCSCSRFEPGPSFRNSSNEFADLEDHNRKLCSACLRSVIIDSNDAIPLWSSILEFMDWHLGLFSSYDSSNPSNIDLSNSGDHHPVKIKMKAIPILIVNHDALNDPCVQGSGHGHGNTRGLCMYEYRVMPALLSGIGGRISQGGHLKDFMNRKRSKSSVFQTVWNNLSNSLQSSNITAILCLKGLPRDLVSSILAHEATHAWFKLHPNYDPTSPIPLKYEEGCCQLMAFHMLAHLDSINNTPKIFNSAGRNLSDENQPTDSKLRQYFRYCIETDTSETYGDGFRLAGQAYAKCNSMVTLLDHVAVHKCFPS